MSKYSLRETLSIAHTAECKLHIAANRPDRGLRFLLGHALTLDSVTLRLVEIENEITTVQQPSHASDVKFQSMCSRSTTRKKSPPPSRLTETLSNDEEEYDEEDEAVGNFSSEDDQDELALVRFPSGAAQPPQEPPPLVQSDDSSDEEDPPSPELPSEDFLRALTKGEGDKDLTDMYATVKNCPCHEHQENAPKLGRIWEIPAEAGKERAAGIRVAVAEVSA